MNYLAHIFLAGKNEDWQVGGFIADAVKGRVINNYSKGIQEGIWLHRAIDQYTDVHPVVKSLIMNLKPKYKRYSGVITDMFFDHFLSKYWTHFSNQPLNSFAQNFYVLILKHYLTIPVKCKMIVPFMVYNNWLMTYGNIQGLQKRLHGMSQRTQFYSGMDRAVIDLQADYSYYKNMFMQFFPELVKFTENLKSSNPSCIIPEKQSQKTVP